MERLTDPVIDSLIRSLNRGSRAQLDRGMHFPVGWALSRDFMTLREVYQYATHTAGTIAASSPSPTSPRWHRPAHRCPVT